MFHPVVLFQALVFTVIFSILILMLFIKILRMRYESGILFFRKSVDSAYWGVYKGAVVKRGELARVALPKQAGLVESVSGSSRYAAGKAVKSARD